ncbi:Arylsulfatase A [Parapedobacter indicus]|uniref:Arylsulfatase A n=2 Tax=Parapedobacter indicus TaxID=1477437 RepID=A0A1I3VP38_9SPHI|nr:arylsulfatase A-like enzyme [Parapedobacter indicus]SFJ97148.1 Arylsulfatase A [Parapedobacter indicus]
MRFLVPLIGLLIVGCAFSYAQPTMKKQTASNGYNVLFIMVDDLRPQLGCYGDTLVKTPNIDQLAGRGTVFNRAYCQMALCNPSRASLLTGLRPEETGVFNLTTHFREQVPDAVTLPQLFKNNGWFSQGLYKIFHLIPSDPRAFGNMDDPISWSAPLWLPTRSVYGPKGEAVRQQKLAEMEAKGEQMDYGNIPRGFATEAPEMADSLLADGQTAEQAVKALAELKDKRFFLAVGFYKPHLPFIAPKKYWDMYRTEDIILPENRYAPMGAPKFALTKYADLRVYEDYKHVRNEDDLPLDRQRELLHGYLACISYVDGQVGKILAALDSLSLRDSTIVVLVGDHGYQVGEHNMWATKHTNYETSARAPLIVAKPRQRAQGHVSQALVEFVDIYPTIADLCHLDSPEALTGQSFAALLDDPRAEWDKTIARSQYPKNVKGERLMGRSIRTDRYRLVEWQSKSGEEPVWELYDHAKDPDENRNVAEAPEYQEALQTLSQLLHDNWE